MGRFSDKHQSLPSSPSMERSPHVCQESCKGDRGQGTLLLRVHMLVVVSKLLSSNLDRLVACLPPCLCSHLEDWGWSEIGLGNKALRIIMDDTAVCLFQGTEQGSVFIAIRFAYPSPSRQPVPHHLSIVIPIARAVRRHGLRCHACNRTPALALGVAGWIGGGMGCRAFVFSCTQCHILV